MYVIFLLAVGQRMAIRKKKMSCNSNIFNVFIGRKNVNEFGSKIGYQKVLNIFNEDVCVCAVVSLCIRRVVE